MAFSACGRGLRVLAGEYVPHAAEESIPRGRGLIAPGIRGVLVTGLLLPGANHRGGTSGGALVRSTSDHGYRAGDLPPDRPREVTVRGGSDPPPPPIHRLRRASETSARIDADVGRCDQYHRVTDRLSSLPVLGAGAVCGRVCLVCVVRDPPVGRGPFCQTVWSL